ncbi:AbrB/MazE/SpoVT family DNA-binding domain-containing protein [Candidatus Woesearchaeota archaeon]|nr:AbrB/MazE/SpoVT family DNA-binding domain-containing protein [Candidatus Woesearchaeota archaeon]
MWRKDGKDKNRMERNRSKNLLTVKLRKVGKSNIVTVPQPIMEAENLKEGQKLELKIEAGKLVLTL